MSMWGTLAKVAIGYAAAKGIDHLARNKGLGAISGGAQIPSGKANADPIPGTEGMQAMLSQMAGGMAGMQDMVTKFASQSGLDLSAFTGGSGGSGQGGLLSGDAGGAAGMAGVLSALGGAAAMGSKNVGGLLDQFAQAAPPEAEDNAALLLRAMIQAAKSDGSIDPAEQEKILEMLGDDADESDMQFVRDQLNAEVDIDGLAAATPAGMQMQVYSMSLMSIRVDTQPEAQYLDNLAKALGLNQQAVNALHMQMGVQPLYS